MDEKIIDAASSRRYFFFKQAKFDANNGLFKNLVKYKEKEQVENVHLFSSSSLSR